MVVGENWYLIARYFEFRKLLYPLHSLISPYNLIILYTLKFVKSG